MDTQTLETRETQTEPLNAQDRCDGCGAPALHRVTMNAGNELLFCNHHAVQHRDALTDRYSAWQDESYRIPGV